MLSFEFFHRFLLSRRAGSLVKSIARISIVGIWLGVTALIIVMSVMNGFNRSIKGRMLEVEPHLVIDFTGDMDLEQTYQHPVYEQLKSDPKNLMAPVTKQDVILRTREGYVQHAIANGVTAERLHDLIEYGAKKRGQLEPELLDKVKGMKPGEVVLGMGLADAIGLFKDDTVVLIPPENLLLPASEIPVVSQATVKGFMLTDVARVDDHSFFYIIGQSFPRLKNSASRVTSLEVWLEDAYSAASVKAGLSQEGVKVETK